MIVSTKLAPKFEGPIDMQYVHMYVDHVHVKILCIIPTVNEKNAKMTLDVAPAEIRHY